MADFNGEFEIRVPKAFRKVLFNVEADFAIIEKGEVFELSTLAPEKRHALFVAEAGCVELNVVDADRKPAPDAWVYATLSSDRTVLAMFGLNRRLQPCDGNGKTLLRGVPASGIGIVAAAPGFAPTDLRLQGFAPLRTTPVQLILQKGNVLRGRVADESGSGIAGIGLSLDANIFRMNNLGTCVSDAQGLFRIDGVPAGRHSISVHCPGRIPRDPLPQIEIPARATTREPTIILIEGDRVSGRVLDDRGAGVEQAIVVAVSDSNTKNPGSQAARLRNMRQETVSGKDGRFQLTGLGTAPFVISAFHPDFGATGVAGVASHAEGVELSLRQGLAFTGAVRQARTGLPVANAQISVSPREWKNINIDRDLLNFFAIAGADGSYRTAALQPGKYDIRAQAAGFLPAVEKNVELAEGASLQTVHFDLEPAGTVRGKTVDPATGQPVAGVELISFGDSRGAHIKEEVRMNVADPGRCLSDEQGMFELTGLAGGNYRIRSKHDRFVENETKVSVQAGETLDNVTIEMDRGGSAAGVAKDGEGELYAGGEVLAIPQHEDVSRGVIYQNQRRLTIGADGSFLFDGLLRGPWEIQARPAMDAVRHPNPSIDVIGARVMIEKGKTTAVAFILPERGCTVNGVVTRGGLPVAGTMLTIEYKNEVESNDPVASGRLRATTLDDGTYLFRHIRGGEATVAMRIPGVTKSGAGRWRQKVTFPSSGTFTLNIQVPATATVEGTVTAKGTGAPIANMAVIASATGEGSKEGALQSSVVQTDENGRYRIENLFPGTYRIQVGGSASGKSQPFSKFVGQTMPDISLAEGAVETLDFSLETGGVLVVEALDDAGVPLAGVRVTFVRKTGSQDPAESVNKRFLSGLPIGDISYGDGNIQRTMVTNGQGIATFEGLESGDYRLTGKRSGYLHAAGDATGVLVGRESRSQLQFSQGARVQIAVAQADGSPATLFYISISDEKNPDVYNWVDERFKGDPGAQVREHTVILPSGRYSIRASTTEGFSGAQKFDSNGSGSQKLTITVAKGSKGK